MQGPGCNDFYAYVSVVSHSHSNKCGLFIKLPALNTVILFGRVLGNCELTE